MAAKRLAFDRLMFGAGQADQKLFEQPCKAYQKRYNLNLRLNDEKPLNFR